MTIRHDTHPRLCWVVNHLVGLYTALAVTILVALAFLEALT